MRATRRQKTGFTLLIAAIMLVFVGCSKEHNLDDGMDTSPVIVTDIDMDVDIDTDTDVDTDTDTDVVTDTDTDVYKNTDKDAGTDTDTDVDTDTGEKPGVDFPGAGNAGADKPLVPGVGPETANECGAGKASATDTPEDIEQLVECYYVDGSDVPAAAIELIVEVVNDVKRIHIRLTLNPQFADNSYGRNAVGWENSENETHTFKDLTGSDYAELMLYDSEGKLVLRFQVDYLSEDKDLFPSGYGTMGVTGRDGKMHDDGDESYILGVATSLSRNINGCGLDQYTNDSPKSDSEYTPDDPLTGEWDYRIVYEIWVDADPFGKAGFGEAIIEKIHASPNKTGSYTIDVFSDDCPRESWVKPV